MGARINFAKGTAPRSEDGQLMLLQKWLLKIQAAASVPAANNYPTTSDSKRATLVKIVRAIGT